MRNLCLIIICGGSLLFAESPLQFNVALQRRMAIDSGLKSLEHQQSAIKLQTTVSNAMAPTSFEAIFEDFGKDELEFSISQDFELPAIRKKRAGLIASRMNMLEVNAQAYHQRRRAELTLFFLDATMTHKQLTLSVQRVEILEQMLTWQTRQFHEGALAESELIRTQLAVAEMTSQIDQVNARLAGIAAELTAYLDSTVQVQQLPKTLPDYPNQGTIQEFWKHYEQAPQLLHQRAIMGQVHAEMKLSDTPMVSAISLSGGYKILPEMDRGFPIVGVSLNAPLFSKRSQAVKLQEFQLESAREDYSLLSNELEQYAIQWQQSWLSSKSQLQNLQTTMIPKAEQLYQKIDEEYRSGARRYLEVLDAQSLLYDFHEEAIDIELQLATRLLEMNNILGVTVYEFE